MEFKNAIDDIEKLYQSCSYTYHNIATHIFQKRAPNMFNISYSLFKECIQQRKAVDIMSVGYKELIPETITIKSIRKTFSFNPEDTVDLLLIRNSLWVQSFTKDATISPLWTFLRINMSNWG
jgi:hypothetical protein